MFSKQTYVSRRNRLKNQLKSGILLFLGNDETGMNYTDNTYHYRQDSTFLYFFGLDYAGLNAIIDIDENREIIFGDELTIDHIVWMGTQPSIKEKSEAVGITETAPLSDLKSYLTNAVAKGRTIHHLPTYRPEHQIKLLNWLDVHPNIADKNASPEFIKAVVDQRNYKSSEEIIQIEQAVNITAEMHLTAMRMARPGMKEAEIAAAVQEVAIRAGGQLSFPTIATINGQTLHNHYHGNTLKSGDMVLIDCGAENIMHYAGDMLSTFPVDKSFTTRQKEIYQVALNAHEAGIAELRPGVRFKDVHLKVCRTIAEGMKQMGFMKGDLDEAIQQGLCSFLPMRNRTYDGIGRSRYGKPGGSLRRLQRRS